MTEPLRNADGRVECYTTLQGETVCVDCGMDLTGCRPVMLLPPRKCSNCGGIIK